MPDTTLGTYLSSLIERMMNVAGRAISDLTPEEVHDTHAGQTNCIGFDVWHAVRTADNIINFAFERAQPVWLAGGFQERWGLPRIDQGTGMEPAVAYSLKFPDPEEFKRYVDAVAESVVPKVAGMTDEYLFGLTRLVPQGEITRIQAIGQQVIVHGSGHLGRCDLARTLMGNSGLGF